MQAPICLLNENKSETSIYLCIVELLTRLDKLPCKRVNKYRKKEGLFRTELDLQCLQTNRITVNNPKQ